MMNSAMLCSLIVRVVALDRICSLLVISRKLYIMITSSSTDFLLLIGRIQPLCLRCTV